MYIILYTFITFNILNLQNKLNKFKLPHEKLLVKILGFEVSFNQFTDKFRRNVKLSKYLLSVKSD